MAQQKQKWTKGMTITLMIIVAFIFWISSMISSADKKEAERIAADPVAQNEKLLKEQFSTWDGSHINLVATVKANMNDPESFEHVVTQSWKLPGDSLKVVMKFRGNNAFGGKVLNRVTAIADINGNILSLQND